jgi:hypothetical protein
VLSVAIGCSSSDTPLGPSAPQGQQPSAALVSALSNLHLLSCSPQPYAATTKTVGVTGGVITVGTHRLVIPAGALTRSVTVKAEQMTGQFNSVRFSPEGLQFAKPATLTLSYANCSPLMVIKRVVYTSDLLRILELLPSLDNIFSRTVSAPIRHFSRYAVAW